MSLRIPLGYAELSIGFRNVLDPELMYSAIGFQFDDEAPLEVPLGIAQEALDQFVDLVLPSIQFEYHLEGSFVTIGSGGTDDIRFELPNTTAGGNGDTAAPPNVAYLVRKVGVGGGRRGRGRMYLPGVDALEMNSAGTLTPGFITTLGSAIDDWFGALVDTTDSLGPRLFHQSEPWTPTVIAGLTLQSKVATQRRRLRP